MHQKNPRKDVFFKKVKEIIMKKLLAIAGISAMMMASTGVNAKTGMICFAWFDTELANNTKFNCDGTRWSIEDIYANNYKVISTVGYENKSVRIFIEKD